MSKKRTPYNRKARHHPQACIKHRLQQRWCQCRKTSYAWVLADKVQP